MLTKPAPKFSRLCPVIKTNFRPMEVRKGSYPFIDNKQTDILKMKIKSK